MQSTHYRTIKKRSSFYGFYYDLKIREIATITKASVSTVKSRLQRGIKNWNDIWLILEEAIMYDPKTKWCIRMVAEL